MEELFTFPINLSETIKHLRQDLKDDWFFDCIRYEDLLSNKNDLIEILQKNLETGNGNYEAGDRAVYNVPKSSLGLRYSLEFDFYDRFLYQAIATYLIQYFDPVLSNRVFSHRFNKYGDKKYLFRHKINLWKTFESICEISVENGKIILITDLINYFEQISLEVIECSFVKMLSKIKASGSEKNTIRSSVNMLVELLKKWCYNERHGLPQNRDASSFIANVVLDSVDKKMVEMGYDYLRYVDDIRVICEDELEARRALKNLISELRKIALNINSSKTIILDKKSDRFLEFFPSSDERMIQIDTMWKSKSKKVIARSIPVLLDFFNELLESGNTQSRSFRYCVNRIKTLISSNIFDTRSIFASEMADAIINEFYGQPVTTDQFCRLLIDLELSEVQKRTIADYVVDERKAIYGWQNYHILMLLAHHKYRSNRLISYCKKKLEGENQQPEIPGCLIYLASVVEESELEELINYFDDKWSYQHKRHFLIALQNVPSAKLKPLYGRFDFRLEGTVKRMKDNKKFKNQTVYIKDFNITTIEDIYDELSHYEK